MRPIILGLVATLCASPALAQAGDGPLPTAPAAGEAASDAPLPTAPEAPSAAGLKTRQPTERCAGVYGALARQQTNFGAEASLLTEVYPNFAAIDFGARLALLAERVQTEPARLAAQSEEVRQEAYDVLIRAETDGDPETDRVKAVVLTSDACDVQFGFEPRLGGG